MYIILIVSIILFVVPIIITIVMRREKKITAELKEFAGRYKFDFQETGDVGLMDEMVSFQLFSKGRSRKIRNVMRAKTQESELMVLEYSYKTNSGKNSHHWNQTVVFFQSDLLELPSFVLRPENIFHKIGSTFGYQDIDFDTHPEFSTNLLLRGEDEAQIRKIFNTRVLHHFNGINRISVEGVGDKLIYYKNNKRIKIETLKSFIDEGIQVFNLFSKTEVL